VDAAYLDSDDGVAMGMGGTGFWRNPVEVESLLKRFGVEKTMSVVVARTDEFAIEIKRSGGAPLDFVLIDADHSFKGFGADFQTYAELLAPNGVILCHDSEVPAGYWNCPFGVMRYFREVVCKDPRFEAMSLPIWPGLGIVRKVAAVPVPRIKPPSRWVRARRYILQRLPISETTRQRLRGLFNRLSKSLEGR
jgi:hypothetical protein